MALIKDQARDEVVDHEAAIAADAEAALRGVIELAARAAGEAGFGRDLLTLRQRIHTIRGACGFAGLRVLMGNLVQIEDLLDQVSAGATDRTLHAAGAIARDVLNGSLGSLLASAPCAAASARRRAGESLWWSERLIQDMARDLGRPTLLVVRGGEIEVPPDIAACLDTCLQHLVRNAMVHGIEDAAEREAQGKPSVGLISISIDRLERSICVRVADNGRGVQGLDLAALFRPGASSVARVGANAGRGLGLSIVWDRCAAVGGSVAVTSEAGRGATFTLNLPC
jgi:chemotaxis protein histidine kinase CheA